MALQKHLLRNHVQVPLRPSSAAPAGPHIASGNAVRDERCCCSEWACKHWERRCGRRPSTDANPSLAPAAEHVWRAGQGKRMAGCLRVDTAYATARARGCDAVAGVSCKAGAAAGAVGCRGIHRLRLRLSRHALVPWRCPCRKAARQPLALSFRRAGTAAPPLPLGTAVLAGMRLADP